MLTHKGTVTLTTSRLTLRRFMLDDAQAMFENWATDQKVNKFLSWDLHESVEFTRELLTKWIANYDNLECYNWVIEYNQTVIGNIIIHDIDTKREHFELGYNIGSKWWNMGIMTEAVAEVIRFAFKELNANKVCGLHDTENPASGRVMQKNGMTQEGLLREHAKRRDGTRGDLAYYAILKREWRGK
ncbi:MAG: GNAT family N-acetyltransferase [Oscillospiraceae bacterium]|nr:GNAT family N-acetyltransferase [Oscillospiraceae bacterium]